MSSVRTIQPTNALVLKLYFYTPFCHTCDMLWSILIIFWELFIISKAYIKKKHGWVIKYIKIILTLVHLLILLYALFVNAWAW